MITSPRAPARSTQIIQRQATPTDHRLLAIRGDFVPGIVLRLNQIAAGIAVKPHPPKALAMRVGDSSLCRWLIHVQTGLCLGEVVL